MVASDAHWRTSQTFPPVSRPWADDWVVFNPLSGHTHLLDLVSAELIRALIEAPRSQASLCAQVARLLDLDNDGPLAATVESLLRRLDEEGLIEPVDPC
jgi:PqqD family protein of HPr-rel-A system